MGTAICMWICLILGIVSFFTGLMSDHDIIGCIVCLLFLFLGAKVFNNAPEEFRKQVCDLQRREESKKLQGGYKCPSCGMMAGHRTSADKLGKMYKCANCKYMW